MRVPARLERKIYPAGYLGLFEQNENLSWALSRKVKVRQTMGKTMKVLRLCRLAAIAFVAAVVGAGAAHADLRGLWQAQDGATVRVKPCGKGICATLASAKSAADPATGGPWTDKHNPDPEKRNRLLVGVAVFVMMPDGPEKWSGTVYNTDDGHTYPGHVMEIDAGTLKVEGCSLVCGSQNMRRID